MALVELRNVSKIYHLGGEEIRALDDVTLDIDLGEFISIIGPSGSGKSTLMHILGCLDSPTKGTITLDGTMIQDASTAQLARIRNQKIGFIFQAYLLFPELDALENVCLPARMGRIDSAAAEARGRDLLTRVGLGERLEHKPYELSGGEQQRVALARALINSPEIILADEPTGNLDSRTGDEIIELLCALRLERQSTMIIATHDAKVAARAPKVLELVDGRIVEAR